MEKLGDRILQAEDEELVASDFALVFEANHKTNHYHRRNS
jgi:hypothetical protein